jgi:hypothetical protein
MKRHKLKQELTLGNATFHSQYIFETFATVYLINLVKTKAVKKDVDFPVGSQINYAEYTVPALRKMVTLAVKLDGN